MNKISEKINVIQVHSDQMIILVALICLKNLRDKCQLVSLTNHQHHPSGKAKQLIGSDICNVPIVWCMQFLTWNISTVHGVLTAIRVLGMYSYV